jgi:hypothetical protein
MVREIQSERMTSLDATEMYSNEYVLMRLDGRDTQPATGTVLYAGEKEADLWAVFEKLDDKNYCGVFEGVNLMPSFGGTVCAGFWAYRS